MDSTGTLSVVADNGEAALDILELRGLVMLAQFHGLAADYEQLLHAYGENGTITETDLVLAARHLGLKARVISQPAARIAMANLPALALDDDEGAFIIAQANDTEVLIHDLRLRRPKVLKRETFDQRYGGRLMVVVSRASVLGDLARFDFRWFVPAVVKYRRLLLEVFVVSLFIQLFALATPLFYQVVMDKVLANNGLSILNVICVGLISVAVFEVVLGGLRTYVFGHTTSRIDVELGARLFRHIMALPLAYFESRRVGDTMALVRELESIRTFLTGQSLTSVLDLLFTGVFLAVMWMYSGWLTLIVVLSLPVISAVITPVLRARLDRKFARGADNQAFLVETVTGIGTVKAMAVDTCAVKSWDKHLASYVAASSSVTKVATLGQPAVLKLDSYPFTRYGYLEGEVSSVSTDAMQDENRAGVSRAHPPAQRQCEPQWPCAPCECRLVSQCGHSHRPSPGHRLSA